MDLYITKNGDVIINKLIITPDANSTTEDILNYIDMVGLDTLLDKYKDLEYYLAVSLIYIAELDKYYLWDETYI